MRWLSQWAAGVCCAAVGCTVLELLNPDGVMQKPMRYVLALFFLAVLVLPLSDSGAVALPDGEPAASEIHDTVEELIRQQTIRMAEEELAGAIRQTAALVGAAPSEISVTIVQAEDGSYLLEQIRIVLPENQRLLENTLAFRIEAQMGLRPVFVYAAEQH